MNFLSPEALIIFPLAVLLDLAGIILVVFGFDDFFITDIIGFATIGVWSFFRSQIKGKETTTEMPAFGEKRELAKKTKQLGKVGARVQKAAEAAEKASKVAEAAGDVEKAGKLAKKAKWLKRLKFLEFIPYVGALPFWTISVYFELKD